MTTPTSKTTTPSSFAAPITQLLVGIQTLFSGFSLAFEKGMRAYIFIPILTNILLFSLMTWFIFNQFNQWIEQTTLAWTLPNWLSLLQPAIDFVLGAAETILWILLVVTMLLFTGSTFTAITHIIAAPFNGYLAERAEARQRPLNYPSQTTPQLLKRTLIRELVKLKYWFSRLIALFFITLFMGFIPIINLAAPFLWFAFGSWMMAIQYIDFPADNNGLDFSTTLKRLQQQRWAVLGFGAVIMGATLLPLVNLVIVPVAICAATILWVDRVDQAREPIPSNLNKH